MRRSLASAPEVNTATQACGWLWLKTGFSCARGTTNQRAGSAPSRKNRVEQFRSARSKFQFEVNRSAARVFATQSLRRSARSTTQKDRKSGWKDSPNPSDCSQRSSSFLLDSVCESFQVVNAMASTPARYWVGRATQDRARNRNARKSRSLQLRHWIELQYNLWISQTLPRVEAKLDHGSGAVNLP